MNRLNNIKENMEPWIKQKVDASINAEMEYIEQHLNKVREDFIDKIMQIIETGNPTIDQLIICYLSSSIAIKKYELCLIPFKGMPFIQKLHNEIYIEYPDLFKPLLSIENELEEVMRKNFVHILPYEVEEIRRDCMNRYGHQLREIFCRIFNTTKGNIQVYFGIFMGDVWEVGRI